MSNILQEGLMNRPIGIVSKNYDFVKENLRRNIGSCSFDYDGVGTPIGQLADTELNSKVSPWFYKNATKSQYSNYLSYIGSVYSNGTLAPLNVESPEERIRNFDLASLCLDNNKVGVIRNWGVGVATPLVNLVIKNGTNSNNISDTRLGMINSFYLDMTLQNSRHDLWRRYSWGVQPNLHGDGYPYIFNVTQGAYSLFGFDGILGMSTGEYHRKDGMVRRNEDLTSHLNLTIPHGATFNTTTIDDSWNLIQASSERTQSFITKSMYGFDLLDTNHNIVFDSKDTTNYSHITGKKYYATDGSHGRSYLNAISSAIGEDDNNGRIGYDFLDEGNTQPIRYKFIDIGNDNSQAAQTSLSYAEEENGRTWSTDYSKSYNEGTNYGKVGTYNQYLQNTNDIIAYTNQRFQMGKYDTLIARFHTDEYHSATEARQARSYLQSATSKYGMSHGRNLLRKDHGSGTNNKNGEGYSNPYCRVWTYHHQYKSLMDTIRPLRDEKGVQKYENTELGDIQINRQRLTDYGVKMSNGLVRFAPTIDESTSDIKRKESIKRCMFSIENLAWKHERNAFKGYEDQKGPLGGRIMWFPPYDLRFNENVSVQWNSTQFIGRGENIYTYTNTERTGNLSFKVLIDHPSILNYWKKNPSSGVTTESIGDVDDIDSMEQKILRFFAGCEPLNPKRGVMESSSQTKSSEQEVRVDVKPELTPITTVKETESVIYFYVFFPNNYSGVDDRNGVVNPIDYLINGMGCQKILTSDNKEQDIAVDTFKRYLGYEMLEKFNGKGDNVGISYTDTNLDGEPHKLNDITVGGTQYKLAAYKKYPNKTGGTNYWGYRVDKRVDDEVLTNVGNCENYLDTKSYGLNCDGYTKLIKYHPEAQAYGENLYSLAEIYAALTQHGEDLLGKTINKERVAILTDIFYPKNNEWEVTKVEIGGFASSTGYKKSNEILNKNRAETIMHWLSKQSDIFQKDNLLEITMTDIGDVQKSKNINDLIVKVYQCAKVAIHLKNKAEVIDYMNQQTPSDFTTNKMSVTSHSIINQELKAKMDAKLANANMEKLSSVQRNEINSTAEYNQRLALQTYEEITHSGKTTNNNTSSGYGKEYEFFEMLGEKAPFMHHKITDKIKFFDPAFHSVTPEGFNSRLTFLHQCTRQGSTSSSSDARGLTANNLAFGAPPICVLRIGDFYNTKIIIDSLHITYDDASWDLNDEGIGVMPMLAEITIGFKFLGGSDLSGPIARLQNAVSFNYYANTTVYDDRAEQVTYNNEGEVQNLKINEL